MMLQPERCEFVATQQSTTNVFLLLKDLNCFFLMTPDADKHIPVRKGFKLSVIFSSRQSPQSDRYEVSYLTAC